MSVNGSASIEFTIAELVAFVDVIGAPAFSGLGEADIPEDAAERRALVDDGGRSLESRGIFAHGASASTGQLGSIVLYLAASPALALAAERRDAVDSDTRLFLAQPGLAVEQTPTAAGYRFSLVPTGSVVERVLEMLMLVPRSAPESDELSLREADLAAIEQGAADPAIAAEFGAALRAGGGEVRCLYPRGGRIEGGELSWVGDGNTGYWLLEPAETGNGAEPAPALRVRPVAGEELIEELLSYLPGA